MTRPVGCQCSYDDPGMCSVCERFYEDMSAEDRAEAHLRDADEDDVDEAQEWFDYDRDC